MRWGRRIVTDRMVWRRIGSWPGVYCNSPRNRVALKPPSPLPTYSSQTPSSLHPVTRQGIESRPYALFVSVGSHFKMVCLTSGVVDSM